MFRALEAKPSVLIAWLLKWPLSPKILSGPQTCSQVAKVATPLQIISHEWHRVLFVGKDKWLFMTLGATSGFSPLSEPPWISLYILYCSIKITSFWPLVRWLGRLVQGQRRFVSDKIPRTRRIDPQAVESNDVQSGFLKWLFEVAFKWRSIFSKLRSNWNGIWIRNH